MSDKEALNQSDTRAARLLLETDNVTKFDKETAMLWAAVSSLEYKPDAAAT